MKFIIPIILILNILTGCSTAGGIYKKNDLKNGEFSFARTALSVLSIVAVVAVIN